MKVGITGVHTGCHRSPGLAVSKALHLSGRYELIAIDYDNLATGLYLPFFKAIEVVSWSADPIRLFDRIQKIHQKHHLDILVPCLNNDVGPFAEIASQLLSLGIDTLLPSKLSIEARNKIALSGLVEQLGLRYPRTCVCCSEAELEAALETIGCPCVIKGPESGVFPVRNKDLFDYHATYCTASFDFPVLVQEWMEGEEYSAFFLCDKCSHDLVSATVKKIGIADDGESWMSVLVDCSEFKPYIKKLIEILGWVGPIECDLLKRGDDIFLLDVNPRFPAWIDGLALAGCNAPLLATYLAQNLEPPPPQPLPAGMVFFKDFEDVCFPVDSMISEQFYGIKRHE